MSFIIPSDTHSAGDIGHISDHNNIADVLTALANQALYREILTTTAVTFPRWACSQGTSTLVTQTLYVTLIPMFQNTVVNNLSFCTKGTSTGGATITNGWYVLLDSGLVVRAVTANQNGSATFLASTNTVYPLATNSYTTTYSGYYYAGIMVECGTMPNLASPAGTSFTSGLNALPIIGGTSSTGQTTPPSTGTTMGSLSVANAFLAWASTS